MAINDTFVDTLGNVIGRVSPGLTGASAYLSPLVKKILMGRT